MLNYKDFSLNIGTYVLSSSRAFVMSSSSKFKEIFEAKEINH